jgi:phosphatidylglycerophosphate synthase
MVWESGSMPSQSTLDAQAQSLTDNVINPLCHLVPSFVSPLHLTCLAFICGLISCWQICHEHNFRALIFWGCNRLLGGLDGAVARNRGKESEFGAFLDLLGSFWVYSTIPISCGLAVSALDDLKQPFTHLSPSNSPWLSIAVLEAMFHIHNFVLFYAAAVIEKHKQAGKNPMKELANVAMRPALVESFESGVIFTLMLAWPRRIEALCWAMVLLMGVGTIHKVQWLFRALFGS